MHHFAEHRDATPRENPGQVYDQSLTCFVNCCQPAI